MKFSVRENRIFLNEDIEVYLCDNYAFMEENRQTLQIYGASKSVVAVSRSIKDATLLNALEKYRKGRIISLKVDGTKKRFVIQNIEIDLLSQEYKKGAINPNNYILSLYVYEEGEDSPQDSRYLNIEMDYGEEEKSPQEEINKLFN